jgi:hypothetical protein
MDFARRDSVRVQSLHDKISGGTGILLHIFRNQDFDASTSMLGQMCCTTISNSNSLSHGRYGANAVETKNDALYQHSNLARNSFISTSEFNGDPGLHHAFRSIP